MKNLGRVFVVLLIFLLASMTIACGGNRGGQDSDDPLVYTITFDTNGGSPIAALSLTKGTSIPEFSTPVKEGYTFGGWLEKNAYDNLIPYEKKEIMPGKSITLHANWIAKQYTITFDVGNDLENVTINGNLTQQVSFLDDAVPPFCSHEGYILQSWEGDYQRVTKNATVTAIWKIKNFTCSFLPGADDALIDSGEATHSISYGAKITPPTYSREGYYFVEWEFSSTGINLDNVTKAFVATAKWESYVTATFNGNGGTLNGGIEVQKLRKGEAAIPPTYSKEGHEFIRFSIDPPGIVNIDNVLIDFTATAVWEISTFSVAFSPGCEGTTKIDGEESQTINYGSAATPPTYEKAGYVLVGFTLEPSNANLQSVKCNIVATGVWEEGYLVIFEPCGGTLLSGNLTQVVKYGESAVLPILEKEGFSYTFDTSHENITGTTMIKAVWYTQGLEFQNKEGGYKVQGSTLLTSNETEEIIIPASYQGSPVIEITKEAFKGNTFITTVDIPNSVTVINKKAFMGCANLTTISIPLGISDILEYAFADCTSLVSIDLPYLANNFRYLEKGVFSGCNNLQSFAMPTNMFSIGEKAFQGCSSLTTVGMHNGIQVLGDYAFDGCSALESFAIPTNIGSYNLGEGVFQNCTSLTSMVIPDNVLVIYDNLFKNCTNLASLTIGYKTESIGKEAFLGCSSLQTLDLPSTVETIGLSAFSGCSSLGSIVLTNVKTIGTYAFKDCENMTSITSFSSKITIINEGVFSGCKSLGNTAIPTNITAIYAKAFSQCTNLTFLQIPFEVNTIGAAAFEGCANLEEISLWFVGEKLNAGKENALLGYIFGTTEYQGTELTTQKYYGEGQEKTIGYYLPANLKTVKLKARVNLPYGAFSGCENLTEINATQGLLNIGAYAFDGCNSLTSLSISAGTTEEIGNHAFSSCSKIESLTLPDSVTAIGEGAFANCSSLTYISLPNGVTAIEDYLFAHCIYLVTIEILGDVTTIGEHAFYNCKELYNFTLPNSVISIGNSAFKWCFKIPNITIPIGVTTIESNTFDGCALLEIVTILGTNLTEIGEYAFNDCETLATLNLPNSIQSIGKYAFKGCSGLTELTLPNQVINIDEGLLQGATSLKFIIIPYGVTYIDKYSLQSIEEVVIPVTIETIWAYSFTHTLKTVYFMGDAAAWSGITKGDFASPSGDPNIIYYSETQQSGCWYFDEDGIPAVWT